MKRKPRGRKLTQEELAHRLHIRHRGAVGRVPDARKERDRRACRDRRSW